MSHELTEEKQSKWAEIRNDYIEEDIGDFYVLHIDAWRTDDENEEGMVIAKLIGIKKDGEPHIYLSYHDITAMIDPYSKEVIEESFDILRKHIMETEK